MSDPTIEETFSPSTVATYQAIKDSLEHGFCTLSNRELAEKAGCSERSVKRALSTLTDQGLVFSSRKGGKRRISLDRFPSIDRQAKLKELCTYIEGFKRKSSSGLFYEGQKATAKNLGISVPVLAEVYRLGEKQGLLRAYREHVGGKEQLCWEVVASDATEAQATALPAPVAAPDPSKELEELRANVEELSKALAASEARAQKAEEERDSLKVAQASMPQDLAEALERIKALEALIDPVDRWIYIEGVKAKEEELQRENWRLQAELERLKSSPSPEEVEEEESNLKRALTIRTLEALTYKEYLTAEELEESEDKIASTLSQRDNIYRRDTLNYKPDLEDLEQVEEDQEEAPRSGGFLPLSLELNEAANAWAWQHKENEDGKMGILEG